MQSEISNWCFYNGAYAKSRKDIRLHHFSSPENRLLSKNFTIISLSNNVIVVCYLETGIQLDTFWRI